MGEKHEDIQDDMTANTDGNGALAAVENRATATTDVNEPQPPKGLSSEEDRDLKDRALALLDQLVDASGSQEMELADGITGIGMQSQRRAGAEIELLKGRMGEILSGDGPSIALKRY